MVLHLKSRLQSFFPGHKNRHLNGANIGTCVDAYSAWHASLQAPFLDFFIPPRCLRCCWQLSTCPVVVWAINWLLC